MNRFNNVILGQKTFVLRNGKILIMKRAEADVFSGFWDFPGGKLESEDTLFGGIAREIMEEAGLKLTKIVLILSTSKIKSQIRDCPTIFRNIYLCFAEGKVRLSKEHSEFKWIKPDDLVNYQFPDDDDIQGALKRIPAILKTIDTRIDYSILYD